ncbi:retrovirus-related pol polyprotein from transposon TNT 1-94 [Tanacetum coccineum]
MIIKKDSEIVKAKGERRSLALKAKKESSDKECSTSRSEDEEYAMVVRDFKKFFKRKGRCDDPNHLIGECPKPPKDKNQRAFIGGSWSDNSEEDDEKAKDETCLVAQASSEICLRVDLEPDEWIKDSGYSKHMTGNRKLAHNGGNVIFGSNLCGNIIGKVDDDLDEDEAIKATEKKNLENDIEDETLEVDEIVNIKESKNHPLGNIIGNLNQRTLRSQAQNQNMSDEFAKIMHAEFEMSMIGELNLFLGLQIKHMEDGIFFNQSKYIKEMLKKFGLEESKPMKTPMSSDTKLTKDEECELVDSTKYRGMIGSLLYLMANGPDIMFNVCLCARFQEDPKTSHLEMVTIPRVIKNDHQNTRIYIPTISNEYTPPLKYELAFVEKQYCHEVRVVDKDFDNINYLNVMFEQIKFECLLKVNEQIVPRFILEFYSQLRLENNPEGHLVAHFVIQNKSFSFTLKEFGQIVGIPIEGHYSFSDKWLLDYLEIGTPSNGLYKTSPPSPREIKALIQIGRNGIITCIRHKKIVDVEENQILNRKIQSHMETWVIFDEKKLGSS